MNRNDPPNRRDEARDGPFAGDARRDPPPGIETDRQKQDAFEKELAAGCLEETRLARHEAHEAGRRQWIEASARINDSPESTVDSDRASLTMGRSMAAAVRSRSALLAGAAACVVIAGLLFFPPNNAIALEQVIERTRKVSTVAFTSRVISYKGGAATLVNSSKNYSSAHSGLREDTFLQDGTPSLTEYLSLERAEWVTLYHRDRSFSRTSMSDSKKKQMATEVSPSIWITRLLECAREEGSRKLERTTIEGRSVQGFEWSYIHSGNRNLKEVIRLWVDEDSLLPVRLVEESHNVAKGTQNHAIISEKFRWNAAIDPALFLPQIPEGYRKRDK